MRNQTAFGVNGKIAIAWITTIAERLALNGGGFMLPGGSVVLGFRETAQGLELKFELLRKATPVSSQQMLDAVWMQLAQRPASQSAYRRWMQAMSTAKDSSYGEISVVSVRVTPRMNARLNIYFRPAGYE